MTKTFSRIVIKESSEVNNSEENFIEGPGQEQKPQKKEKVPRNAPCPCGSGKKYKRCCLNKNIERLEKVFQSTPIVKSIEFYAARIMIETTKYKNLYLHLYKFQIL